MLTPKLAARVKVLDSEGIRQRVELLDRKWRDQAGVGVTRHEVKVVDVRWSDYTRSEGSRQEVKLLDRKWRD
jgi:hypothetical protein